MRVVELQLELRQHRLLAHELCHSSASTSASAPSAGASVSGGGSTIKERMKSLAFVPKSDTAKVGETVQWTNDDQPPHNVTYVNGPVSTSLGTMNTSDKFQLKLTAPG